MRQKGLVVAVLVAAIAAIVFMKLATREPQPAPSTAQAPQEVKSVPVYVAKQAIPIGTVLTAEMVAAQPWPEHLVLAGFMRAEEGSEPAAGMVTRASFQANEPLIKTKLANPNDPSFLAGDLPAGMRVITIPVTPVDGVAGFVMPGDFVDLLYTHEITSDRSKNDITETLLANVKVLAVDQRASNANSLDEKGKLIVPKTVSLMVTPENAHRVRLASKKGSISLTLRSINDQKATDLRYVMRGGDISEAESTSDITVMRGAPDDRVTVVGSPNSNGLGPITQSTPSDDGALSPNVVEVEP